MKDRRMIELTFRKSPMLQSRQRSIQRETKDGESDRSHFSDTE